MQQCVIIDYGNKDAVFDESVKIVDAATDLEIYTARHGTGMPLTTPPFEEWGASLGYAAVIALNHYDCSCFRLMFHEIFLS